MLLMISDVLLTNLYNAYTTAAHCCTHTYAIHYAQDLPNGSLAQLLAKNQSLPFSQIQLFAACLVLALEDSHGAGIHQCTHNLCCCKAAAVAIVLVVAIAVATVC
jgi:hypothetical protein